MQCVCGVVDGHNKIVQRIEATLKVVEQIGHLVGALVALIQTLVQHFDRVYLMLHLHLVELSNAISILIHPQTVAFDSTHKLIEI